MIRTVKIYRVRVFDPTPPGYLEGTAVEAVGTETPVVRRVQVIETATAPNAHGHLFPMDPTWGTWVWSDESGYWRVDGLDPDKRYHVIAYDHTGQYDPVIKINLQPEVDE